MRHLFFLLIGLIVLAFNVYGQNKGPVKENNSRYFRSLNRSECSSFLSANRVNYKNRFSPTVFVSSDNVLELYSTQYVKKQKATIKKEESSAFLTSP